MTTEGTRGNKKLKFLDRNIGILLIYILRFFKTGRSGKPGIKNIKNAAFLKLIIIV